MRNEAALAATGGREAVGSGAREDARPPDPAALRSVAQLGRSARYGAGGDIAARRPYLNQVPGDGKVESGMGSRMGKLRLCSLMFA